MAYCVHCGVKLGEGERRCPLCGTIAVDPAQPLDPNAPRAYPVRLPEQELKKSKRYLLAWAALLLLLPAGLCLLLDALTGGVSWSIYAAGALVLIFLSTAVPLLVTRHKTYWSLLTAFLSLSGYLFLVERISHSEGWFFLIVLPALTLAALQIALIIFLYRRGTLNKLTLLAAALAAVAVQCVGVEWLRSLARCEGTRFLWSPYVLAPCVFLSLVLFFINANRPVREEVRRRVHF